TMDTDVRPRVRRMTAAERATIIYEGLDRGSAAALQYLNENGIFETPETEGPLDRESRGEHAVLVALNVDNGNIQIVGKKDDPGEQLDDIESVLTAELDTRLDPARRAMIISLWTALNENVNDGFRVNSGTNTLRLSSTAARALNTLMFSTNDSQVGDLASSLFKVGLNWRNSERFLHYVFRLVDTPEPAVTVVPA